MYDFVFESYIICIFILDLCIQGCYYSLIIINIVDNKNNIYDFAYDTVFLIRLNISHRSINKNTFLHKISIKIKPETPIITLLNINL